MTLIYWEIRRTNKKSQIYYWKKLKVYILGDINIDFLKCNGHSPTEDHLEMLYSNNFLPIITKPIATSPT